MSLDKLKGAALLNQQLESYTTRSVTARLCDALFKAMPGAPGLPNWNHLDDTFASVAPDASPAIRARAIELSNEAAVDNALFAAKSIDTGDAGITILTGVRSALSLFLGEKGPGSGADQQQKADAALKALGLAYLLTQLIPRDPEQRVHVLQSCDSGLELLLYYVTIEVAVPFGDDVKEAKGSFVKDLVAEQSRRVAGKLLGVIGRKGVQDAQETLDALVDTLDRKALELAPHAGQLAASLQNVLPAVVRGKGPALQDAVAAGADALPAWRYLTARFAAESRVMLAVWEADPASEPKPVPLSEQPVAATPPPPSLPSNLMGAATASSDHPESQLQEASSAPANPFADATAAPANPFADSPAAAAPPANPFADSPAAATPPAPGATPPANPFADSPAAATPPAATPPANPFADSPAAATPPAPAAAAATAAANPFADSPAAATPPANPFADSPAAVAPPAATPPANPFATQPAAAKSQAPPSPQQPEPPKTQAPPPSPVPVLAVMPTPPAFPDSTDAAPLPPPSPTPTAEVAPPAPDLPTEVLPAEHRLNGVYLREMPWGEMWLVFTREGVFSNFPPADVDIDWMAHIDAGHQVGTYRREGDQLTIRWPNGKSTTSAIVRETYHLTVDGQKAARCDFNLTGRLLDGTWAARNGEGRWVFGRDGRYQGPKNAGSYTLVTGGVQLNPVGGSAHTPTLYTTLQPNPERPDCLWIGGTAFDRKPST